MRSPQRSDTLRARRTAAAHTAVTVAAAGLSGLVAAGAALGVADLVAVSVRVEAAPLNAVGAGVVDVTPAAVKDWAIRNFGEDDKLVLKSGVLVLLALFAVALGVLTLRMRRTGSAGVLAFGVLGAAAALSRPGLGAGPTDALPSVAGAVVGAGVLYALSGLLRQRASGQPVRPAAAKGESREVGAPGPTDPPQPPFDRRRFALAASGAAAGSAGAWALGRELGTGRAAEAVASRDRLMLPVPASAAPPLPRGTDLGIDGLSPYLTPSRDFYRVDTALVVPKVDTTAWRLRIHGDGVLRELSLRFADLLRRELIERHVTLTCVSNQVGGPYVGNARWIGVPLAPLLREAGVRPPSRGGPADQLVARSVEGMTIGTPVETVMDGRDAMLALGMNGEPLPFDHGFPARMLVPGLYGYVSACKWLTELELTTFDAYDPYWVRRDWAARAPIKTQSRIDTPRPLSTVKAGPVAVAGVAWAQHRGVERVEVRIDGGPWQAARLAAEDSIDTWRQWVWTWDAEPGSHTLQVRATDRGGDVQTTARAPVLPDGATGRHSVVVDVI
ncbi:molybdopterin-dependent oxidoreductase [Streptomyces sp. NPDC004134]|uniref:molybdopterin-dependent oxidoreductase n=1 Tax=Streptomyces sp. NPDC004134 TaxID=3364691 RepID=UPI00369846E4